jgi:hypothetical protein
VAEGRDEYDELPAEFDDELDEDVEELLASWEAVDSVAAALLRSALADRRGARPPPLNEVAGRLRDEIRAGRDPGSVDAPRQRDGRSAPG